jgi:O-acetyl-ADP-ribose deacetylase (regulator of RNase III)
VTIIRSYGDALDVETGIIVHGCNAKGVMGSGMAKAVKAQYPEAFRVYREAYEMCATRLGTITTVEVDPGKWLVNAITQTDFGRDGKRYVNYEAVARCFRAVRDFGLNVGCSDLHFPMIGAGLGGGDWDVISAIIESETHGMTKYLWLLVE